MNKLEANIQSAITHIQLLRDDLRRVIKSDDVHGEDMLRVAAAIGSGVVFTVTDPEVGVTIPKARHILVAIMRAQGGLIDNAFQKRISWRKPACENAMAKLDEAEYFLTEASAEVA